MSWEKEMDEITTLIANLCPCCGKAELTPGDDASYCEVCGCVFKFEEPKEKS